MANWKTITPFHQSRIRPEMYLGSREEHTQTVLHYNGKKLELREFTWVPALWTGLREVIDNALDELVIRGRGNTLRVDYDPRDMTFTIEDDGQGLPLWEIKEVGSGPAASILLANMFSSSNYEDEDGSRDFEDTAGMNGLGASVTNFTSEWFTILVTGYNSSPEGKSRKPPKREFTQTWTEGMYRKNPVHRTDGYDLGRTSAKKTGTTIMYKPSSKVFDKMTLPADFIEGRLWDIAVTNPKLKVYFNGKHLKPASTKSVDKAVTMTYFKDTQNLGKFFIKDGTFKSHYFVVPGFSEDEEVIHSLINNIPTLQGGAHIDAFRDLFYPMAMKDKLLTKRVRSILKIPLRAKFTLKRADLAKGTLIFCTTRMESPKFDSQTKVRLVSEISSQVRAGFDSGMVECMIKKVTGWASVIADRYQIRLELKDRKEANKKQNDLEKKRLASLEDATGKDRSKCVLFISEGDSAIGGMSDVRDPRIHGGMPLAGKPMCVHGRRRLEVLNNKPLREIMTGVGLRIGETADREKLRYGAVFIAADEDEDGKNITALLIMFFYKFWPELFQDKKNPFLFKFSTPFIILTKGKKRKYIYAADYEKFQQNLHKYKGWDIRRAKGLGSLETEDWEHSLKSPVVHPILDDGNLSETLDLIFNDDRADDRKVWLSRDE